MKKYIVYLIFAVVAVSIAFFIDSKIGKEKHGVDLSFLAQSDSTLNFQVFYTQTKEESFSQESSIEQRVILQGEKKLNFLFLLIQYLH